MVCRRPACLTSSHSPEGPPLREALEGGRWRERVPGQIWRRRHDPHRWVGTAAQAGARCTAGGWGQQAGGAQGKRTVFEDPLPAGHPSEGMLCSLGTRKMQRQAQGVLLHQPIGHTKHRPGIAQPGGAIRTGSPSPPLHAPLPTTTTLLQVFIPCTYCLSHTISLLIYNVHRLLPFSHRWTISSNGAHASAPSLRPGARRETGPLPP